MHFWYKFFTYLIYPFVPLFLLYRKLNGKEHPVRYKEKMSKTHIKREKGFLIWFHVASVGEAMSILPLIENFDKDKNIDKILITTITISSAKVLEKKFHKNKKILHQFLPLDIPIFVSKFINHWQPNISIFIDSEIWPNLILKIKEKNIPLLLINARITKKSFKRWSLIKNYAKKIFEKIDICVVSNKESENFLKILGAKNIKSYGNLKFAKSQSDTKSELSSDFMSKIVNRKIWCAASTHPSEEIFCAKAHSIVKKKHHDILTVIIPRHINRTEKIVNDLKQKNFNVETFQNFQKINNQTDILLINTYGEALKFYKVSKCVFLGKSLIESLKSDSGQNPIEPARLGCKIYHGPNTSNFDDVYKFLNSLEISSEVNSPEELGQSIVNELNKNNEKNYDILKKIENYGTNTLNNVLKEIKIYIKN